MLTPDAAAPEQVDLMSTDAEPKSKVPGVALLRQASGINKAQLPLVKPIPGKSLAVCRVSCVVDRGPENRKECEHILTATACWCLRAEARARGDLRL